MPNEHRADPTPPPHHGQGRGGSKKESSSLRVSPALHPPERPSPRRADIADHGLGRETRYKTIIIPEHYPSRLVSCSPITSQPLGLTLQQRVSVCMVSVWPIHTFNAVDSSCLVCFLHLADRTSSSYIPRWCKVNPATPVPTTAWGAGLENTSGSQKNAKFHREISYINVINTNNTR